MGDERRRWFRCKVPEGTDQAVLRAGVRDILVRLINTSAGGFSAACTGPLNAQLNDILQLKTAAGWFEVRIIYLEQQQDATQLGLERVRDLGDHLKRNWSDLMFDLVGGRLGAAALATALLAGLLLGASLLRQSRQPAADEAQAASHPPQSTPAANRTPPDSP